MSLTSNLNPVATHSFCFLLGLAIMAYSTDDAPVAKEIQYKKNSIGIILTNKKSYIPKNYDNSKFYLAKKLSDQEICLVSNILITFRKLHLKNTFLAQVPRKKNISTLIDEIGNVKKTILVSEFNRVHIDSCNQKNRIIYGS